MTVGPLLENCCGCKDDGCNNKCSINIESTNPDCLRVDTSECWVVKLEPVCPPEVIAWSNVTVETIGCEEWASCSKKYKVSANCKDEKVKACPGDSTPWTLVEKLEEWKWITITTNWCDGDTNSSLIISVNEEELNLHYPKLEIEWSSNLINFGVGWGNWHTIYISDKATETYDNMCCIGFVHNKDFTVDLDSWGNSVRPLFMWEDQWNKWDIFTGNPKMATARWIKILADWYYRLFWQMTVWNNISDDYYINLWRWLLKITWDRFPTGTFLSTAKHWWYARQILLEAWSWIDITNQWEISSWGGNGQTSNWFNWPWMTFNIDTLVDLKEWDVITIWYRPQSNNKSSATSSFRLVWQDDGSYSTFEVLFWWTLLWCYQLAPKRFQENATNQIYEQIWNN